VTINNDFIVNESTEIAPFLAEYHNPYLSQNEEYCDRWIDAIRVIMPNHSKYSKNTHDYAIENHSIKLITSKYLGVINGI